MSILAIVFFCPNKLCAQGDNPSKNGEKSQYELAKELLDESKSIVDSSWEEGLRLAKESYQLSKSNGFNKITIENLFIIAKQVYFYVERNDALPYYTEGFRLAKASNESKWVYKYAEELGKWYLYRAYDKKSARKYFREGLEAALKYEDYKAVAKCYFRIATTYVEEDLGKVRENAKLMEEYYLKADDRSIAAYYTSDLGLRVWNYDMEQAVNLYLRAQELYKDHYFVNLCLGEVYSLYELPDEAIEYLEKANRIYTEQKEKKKNTNYIGPVISSKLAQSYLQVGDYAAADSISNELINYFTEKERYKKNSFPTAYSVQAKVKLEQGKRNEAEALFLKALNVAKLNKISLERIDALINLGEFYLNKNDIEKAKYYCDLGYVDAIEENFKNLQVRSCDCLYKTNKKIAKFEQSTSFLEQKVALIDSLNQRNATAKLVVFEKLRVKEKESALEQQLINEKLSSQKRYNSILSGALIVGSILLLLLLRAFYSLRKQNKKINRQSRDLKNINQHLRMSNDELEKFAYIFSHDLKTPTLVISQFNSILKEELKNNDTYIIKESIKHIDEGTKRMMNLLLDVETYSRSSQEVNRDEEIKLESLIDGIAKDFKTTFPTAKVHLDKSAQKTIVWNRLDLEVLMENVLENGLKYNTSEIPEVHISGKFKNESYVLTIMDNGIGIEDKYKSNIFDMFNRLHNHSEYEGTGLGLSTCKKIVFGFSGDIQFESEKGKGSSFRIYFPKSMVK